MAEDLVEAAETLFEQGHFREAVTLLNTLPTPSEAELLLLGDAYDACDQTDEAEHAYQRAVSMGSVDAIVSLGVLYWSLGDARRAEEMYRRASSKSTLAKENLALLYRDTERFDEAIVAMRHLIRDVSPEWRNELGELLWALNKPEEAQVEFQRGIQEGVNTSWAHLGFFYAARNDKEKAEKVFREALNRGVKDVLFDYASMLSSIPDREREAVELFRQAEDDQAHHYLALLLWKLGDVEGARDEFELSIDVGDPLGALAYADFLDEQGETEQAEELRALVDPRT